MVVETDAIRLEGHSLKALVMILYYVEAETIFPEDHVMQVVMIMFHCVEQ